MLVSQELFYSLELIRCLILEIKNNVEERNHCYQVQQCAMLGTRSMLQPTYTTLLFSHNLPSPPNSNYFLYSVLEI